MFDRKRKNLKIIKHLSGEKGAVLIGLIITFTIVLLLGAAIINITVTSTYNEILTGPQIRAYYIAESGGRYAVPRILQDHIQAEADLHNKTFTLVNGDKFLLLIDNITSPGITYLESEGIISEGGWFESKVKITYKIPRPFSFKYGAFSGSGKLTMKDDAYVDSYDSSVAPWSAATRLENGAIGTNRTNNKSITVQDRTIVYGNAFSGVGSNPAKAIDVEKDADVTGSRSALSAAEIMTPKVMPAGGGTPYDIILNNNDTQVLSGGPIRLDDLEIQDDAVLTISGDVTLYVEGMISVEDRGEIIVQAGGSLTIYADDEMVIQEDARLNVGGNPGDFIVYGTVDFVELQFDDRSISSLAVYAPSAITRVLKEAEIFGSIVTNKINLEDDSKLHYDEVLGKGGGSGGQITQYF
ncbi:hypothetical protein ACFL6W_09715 [Thermodesulfobacteriota bacterium]